MFYSNTPDFIETYQQFLNNTARAPQNNSMYVFNVWGARTQPKFIRYLMFAALLKRNMIVVKNDESITRSTDLSYFFANLTRSTDGIEASTYTSPMYFTKETLDTFNLTHCNSLKIIFVKGQITDTFETRIPNWAEATGAEEILGVSLALKQSPKHRVRVYMRNNHLTIFTTALNGDSLNDFNFVRKVWALLPLIFKYEEEQFTDLITLFRSIINPEADTFWNLLKTFFDNDVTIANLKYTNAQELFTLLVQSQVTRYESLVATAQQATRTALQQYNEALSQQRSAQRRLSEAEANKQEIDMSVIKMLVDKNIVYDIETRYLRREGILNYRCTAPVTAYEKDAAVNIYNRKVCRDFDEDFQKIFKLIFVDEKVLLIFSEDVKVNFNQHTINAQNTGRVTDSTMYFRNPHHNFFNCWGSYGAVITKLMHDFMLEELFFQIKTAIGSLNFTDITVINHFLEELQYRMPGEVYENCPCLIWRGDENTNKHTIAETLEHFKED